MGVALRARHSDHLNPRPSNMSRVLTIGGTALYAIGLTGLAVIVGLSILARIEQANEDATPRIRAESRLAELVSSTAPAALVDDEALDDDTGTLIDEPPVVETVAPAPGPITHLRISRIQLDAEVVDAPFVDKAGGGTWEVPRFKAGHAEYTAAAGEIGNTVIFGHLTSLTLGNVFQHLDRTRVGDVVQVFTSDQTYDYKVIEVRRVPRTEVAVMDPTDYAAISLITCAGVWLPFVQDYAERLLVRGQLVSATAA
jgi:LPXTG-site transpeptidase (sortase) family protein